MRKYMSAIFTEVSFASYKHSFSISLISFTTWSGRTSSVGLNLFPLSTKIVSIPTVCGPEISSFNESPINQNLHMNYSF